MVRHDCDRLVVGLASDFNDNTHLRQVVCFLSLSFSRCLPLMTLQQIYADRHLIALSNSPTVFYTTRDRLYAQDHWRISEGLDIIIITSKM